MFIFALFRIFFLICLLFILLALGLGAFLLLRMRIHPGSVHLHRFGQQNAENYRDDGKIIEGEYKVVEEPRKK